MEALSVLLVDNQDSCTQHLRRLIGMISGTAPVVVRADEADVDTLLSSAFTHVVITPAPLVRETKGFRVCTEILRRVTVPCLGVGLEGRTLIEAFGGGYTPGLERVPGACGAVHHAGTGIFAGLPTGFQAARCAALCPAGLPSELTVTARTGDDAVVGYVHRERPLYGVQFRPESVETEFGARLIANFLGVRHPQASPPAAMVRSSELGVDVTAEQLFTCAFAGDQYAFWLDSAHSTNDAGRFSYLGSGGGPEQLILRAYARGGTAAERTEEDVERLAGSVFDNLRAQLAETPVTAGASPVPFVGGFVGCVGFGLTEPSTDGYPGEATKLDAALMRVDRFAAFDHKSGSRYLVTVGLSERDHEDWCAGVRERTRDRLRPAPYEEPGTACVEHTTDRVTYQRHFDQVQKRLRACGADEGRCGYQITGTSTEDPLTTYGRLRAVDPAPYAAYLRFGDRALLSASAEWFVAIDADGRMETKPVAGTARRDADPDVDAAVRAALVNKGKTHSGDLVWTAAQRGVLERVCEVGSVRGSQEPMSVESYAAVHQLVTTVRGKLKDELDPVACFEAVFPIVAETGGQGIGPADVADGSEARARGGYSGCLGFFGFDGRSEQNVVLRAIVREGERFRIGVGRALTTVSSVDLTFDETRFEADELLRVLGVEQVASAPAVSSSTASRTPVKALGVPHPGSVR